MAGGGKGGNTGAQDKLASLSEGLVNESAPFRNEALSQGTEGLKTGGIGAMIPFITNAITQSKSALSNTLQNLQGRLGTMGLGRSPFGASVLGSTELQGQQQIAGIGPSMTMQFLSQLLGPAFGQPAQGVAGLGSAAGAQASQNVANTGVLGTVLGGMMPHVALAGTLPSFGTASTGPAITAAAGAGAGAGAAAGTADLAGTSSALDALIAAGALF